MTARILAAGTAVVAMGGCVSKDPEPVGSGSTVPTTYPATTYPATMPGATSSSSAGPKATLLPCAVGSLTIALSPADSAKFEASSRLTLTNSGTANCTLRGYPGLQLRVADQDVPTTVRKREPDTEKLVALRPGQHASSLLIWNKYEGQGSTCRPVPTALVVTPPQQPTRRAVPWFTDVSGSVCQGQLSATPFRGDT